MKKILSILLSTIIIVSSFAVSWQVMANQDVVNVTLNRNGGKFANDIPETFEAGDDLPKFEDIERNGLVFAGWYDNSNFTGDSVTTVPTDATGDITYYAKWVKYQTVFDNFDDVTKTWSDNSGENKITTNDDGVNVFSGTKSMRCEIPSGNVAYVLTQSSFTVDGDGVGFWINTPKALSMELQINWDKSNIIKFSVPSGKSFVCIPWSMFGDDYIASLEWPLWAFYLFIKGASAGDVVYIDDVCTYSEMKNDISFELFNGKFVDTDAPFKYIGGMILPEYNSVSKGNLNFAGWYDNAELTGNVITTVPSDASGDLIYYAKWVRSKTVFDNFDDVTKTWSDNSGEGKITTNTDKSNAFSGSNSMKCEIPSGNVAYILSTSSFEIDGDGVGFWIKTPKSLNIELQINYNSASSGKINVPKGESFVFIPWSKFGEDYISSLEWPLWAFQIIIKGAKSGDIVYIDDVGTYYEYNDENISFNKNGGTFSNDEPIKYYPGMELPSCIAIVNDNLIFAGWYDNAEFTGDVLTTVPSDASGDLTYYAKWVKTKTVFDNFDDVTKTWSDNSGEGKITTNTDNANAYSGSKSMKCEIPSGNVAYIFTSDSFTVDGDGVAFWIKTSKSLNIELQINYNAASSGKINVPKGESFVFIPWSKFGEDYISSLEWPLWAFQIIVKGAKSGDIVYIDDVATYIELGGKISFELNGAQFVGEAPTNYKSGMILPNAKDVTKDGSIFAGWYDNTELTGDAITTVPNDATGDLIYYAKWIRSKTVFDKFDDVTKTWRDNSGEGKITTNTDKSNAFSGSNSMKCEIPSSDTAYIFTSDSFTVDGEGIAFWIKTPKSLNIELQINYNSASSGNINVSKGESFVFIPWSKFGEDYISSLEWPLWAFQIIVKGAKSGDIVYIDDVVTYSEFDGNISFELNGAQFVGEAPTNYKAGMILPNAKEIGREGCVFAGWYDNAEFTGDVITTVPSDASGDLIYYAKWVRSKTVFDNFDDVTKTWSDNSGEGKITTNTDKSNAFSGSNSMKCEIPSGNVAYIFTSNTFSVDGKGIAFWINTPKALNIELQINYNAASSGNIDVPKGESFVFIPWSKFGEDYISSLEWPLWAFQIIVKGAKSGDIVYIDDIGTYSEFGGNISFELNGAQFVGEAPTNYKAGMILPSTKDVTKDGSIFAGWYDNAEFTGNVITTVPSDASGDLIYYAKWVRTKTVFDNFDDVTKTWRDNSGEGKITTNTDNANAYSGSKSMKCEIPSSDTAYIFTSDSFTVDGEGIAFWIKTPKSLNIELQINYNSASSGNINVSKGESFVFIPWSKFGEDYISSLEWPLWAFQIIVKGAKSGDIVYIDDVVTYSESIGNISFELNGGSIIGEIPTEYDQGMILPNVSSVNKNGFIFAGWYDNADFKGNPVYVVANDKTGDLTYYAKWVIQNEIFENADDEKSHKTWNDYSTGEKLIPNEDSENCYSGKFALKHTTINNSWNGFATTDKFEITGDGISFWVKTPQRIKLSVTVNYNYKATVTVPNGESFVLIPWSAFGSDYNLGKTHLDCVYINVPNLDGVTVFFDDIGTYSEIKGNVSFELNGGQFVNTAPVEYYHGMFLPKYEDVTKNGLVFAGWYDNEKLEGNPVYTVPKNASGNIKYYAKWVVNVLNFEDFENGIKGWSNWGGENASMMLDKSNVQSGNNSLKYEVLKNLGWNPSLYIKKNLPIVGDGLCFWIKTEQADTIQLKFDHLTDVFTIEPIKLPKGESFVMIPWSQLGDKINDQDKLTEIEFILGKSKGSVYYIDSVGTYHSSTKFEINYNLNGGKFIDDSIVSFKTSATDNTVLPTFENIKRDGFYFAGWYEDKECTTTPIYLLSPSALGANLYAKWVEQDEINHNFDDFADTQDMCDDLDDDSDDYLWSNYREAYEGWRESGGANLYLNTDTNNTAPDSLKSLEVSYEVLGGGYVDAGEEPAALFGNNNWATTFGKRGSNKQGDGIRFWIKSDRTITLAVVFNKQGKSKPYYMPRITIPANVPVLVYQPWSALSNDGYNAFELPRLRFEIFDEIGATGKVWIDDLGVYYNEKIEDYVRVHKDGDVKVTSYNNHIPKNTITELEKYNINYLNKLGTKIPEGATANYIVKYSFKKPDGGLLVKSEYDTVLPGPAWISFKIPKGTDISKIGLYELLYEGSLMNVNYTIEGEWVTYYAINPNAILVLTTNDSSWTPKGGNLIQPNVVQSLKVETTIFIENEEYVDEQTDVNQQLPSDNTQISTGTRRPPKRTPLIVDDTQQIGWIVPAIICGSIAFLIAVGTIIIVICLKRRKNQEAQNNE